MNEYRGSSPSMASHVGGRPDQRFPEPAVKKAVDGQEVLVSIVATVNVTRRQGKIRYVNPVQRGRPSDIEGHSEVVLRAKRIEGEPIREYPLRVDLYSELQPDSDREGLVSAVLPLNPDTRSIELLIAGHVVDVFRVGGSLPEIRRAQRLVANDEKEIRIELELERVMQEGDTYSVQISTDNGRSWQTVGIGLKEPVFSMDRRQFREGVELQVRIIATNGLASSLVATEAFRV
ncbi:hypothetical protein [Paraburkholderia terrae]|uniref:hypothetical protein n=1 Tax=Paraburkholderia terrae TaxID=311230 RepID=UPI0020BE9E6C|nr:hypothetical protein [Paraburkholderia terrae]